jgi:hypothetical protein
MSIEFKIQSVTLQSEDIQEQFPCLISMMNSYLPQRKTPKIRKRKSKETVGSLIEEIIADIEK